MSQSGLINSDTIIPYGGWILLVIALSGAMTDLLWGKIYNWLTLPAIVSGIVVSGVVGGWSGLLGAASAVVAGFFIYGWMFFFRALGAGDVKFLMALGAWGGLPYVLQTALLGLMIGGFFSVGYLIYKGTFLSFLKRMHHFFLTVVYKELELERPQFDLSTQMPFGVPIALASTWVAWGYPLFQAGGIGVWKH